MDIEITSGIFGVCSPQHYDILKDKLTTSGKYPRLKDGTITVHKYIWTKLLNREVPNGMVIDHVDRNPLNFTVDNLRLATYSLNSHNKGTRGNNYGYRGICKNGNNWAAKYGMKHLGNAPTLEEAARIWDSYIIKNVDKNSTHLNFEYTDEQKENIIKQTEKQKAVKVGDDLPSGVTEQHRNGKVMFNVTINGVWVGSFPTSLEATNAASSYRTELETTKMRKHYNTPIQRNEKGEAVIPLRGKLGNGKFSIVTDSTWHDLMLSSWHLRKDNYCGCIRDGKKYLMHIYLSRFWVRNKNDEVVDHIKSGFEHRLDNRLSNLRLASRSQNAANCIRQKKEGDLETGIIRSANNKNAFYVRVKRDGVKYNAYFSTGTEEENLADAREFQKNPRHLSDNENEDRRLLFQNAQSERQTGVVHSKAHSRKNSDHNTLPKYVSIHEENGRVCVVVSRHPTLAKWKQSKKNVPLDVKIQNAINYIETGLKA